MRPSGIDGISSAFCLAKYLQVSLHLQNGHNHSCHHPPTHRASAEEVALDPSALHNTRFKRFLRAKMRGGERPAECEYCWKMEDAGLRSDRYLKSEDYWSAPYLSEVAGAGDGEKTMPRYMEVAFESTCNFKCLYCSPQFSSRWAQEILEYGPYPTSDSFGDLEKLRREARMPIPSGAENAYLEAFWKWWPELRRELRVFRITGGEPLLSRHTWQIFADIEAAPLPKLELALNSNFGVDENQVEKLADKVNRIQGKISRFVLFVSLDSVGERAEYLRYGLDYGQFQRNLRRFLSLVEGKVRLTHMATVNALSVSGLSGLLESVLALKREFPQHSLGIDLPYLRYPSYLSMLILPKSFGSYLDEALSFGKENSRPGEFDAGEIMKLEKLRAFFYSQPAPEPGAMVFQDFRRLILECDRRRGLNFSQVFPELRNFFADYPAAEIPAVRNVEAPVCR